LNDNPSSPQRGPADALAELIRDHPELPHMFWTISPDGHLTGSAYGVEWVDPVAAEFVAVLGGVPYEHEYKGASDGRVRPALHLNACWRDVEFHITVVGCPAPVLSAVTA
jgi:hypothetical protein